MRILGLPVKNIFLDIGLRLIVGVIFLIAGISKLPIQPEWVESVMAIRILPPFLLKPYLSALPWLEITIGSCLILGILTRLFSLVSLPIIVSFIAANVIGLSYNISGGCGCFGELITINYKGALVIDALLLIGALLIFSRRRHFMALDSQLSRLFKFNRFI